VDKVRKVEMSSFSDSAKSQTRNFVFNPTVNRKSVQRLEMRRDVFRFANYQDQTSSSYGLLLLLDDVLGSGSPGYGYGYGYYSCLLVLLLVKLIGGFYIVIR
jgi:hypothetical protein